MLTNIEESDLGVLVTEISGLDLNLKIVYCLYLKTFYLGNIFLEE